jgi:hypothetical protein
MGQVGAKTTWVPGKFETRAAVGYWHWANSGDLASGQRTVNNGVVYPGPGSGNNLGNEFEIVDLMAEATWRIGGTPAVAAQPGDPKDVKGGLGTAAVPAKPGFPIKPYAHLVWNLAPAPNLGVIRVDDDHTLDSRNNGDDVTDGPSDWVDVSDQFAWRVGVKVGEAVKAGLWEINGFYQQVGSDALPDTFNDGDFGNGFTNVKGFGFRAAYAIRDNVTLAFRYLNADFLDPDIAQDTNNGNAAQARTMQFDFNIKF